MLFGLGFHLLLELRFKLKLMYISSQFFLIFVVEQGAFHFGLYSLGYLRCKDHTGRFAAIPAVGFL